MEIKTLIHNKRLERGLTMKELAEKVGVSEATISRWESGKIDNMRRDKIAALADALNIVPALIMGWDSVPDNIVPISTRRFPVLGSVSCGEPQLMTETVETYVDANIRADFALYAKGDSMIDARIYDGDLVFIRKQSVVENGQIAAVAIDDTATLKRFYKYGDLVVLRACNPAYKDIEIRESDGENVKILGLAVAFQSLVK